MTRRLKRVLTLGAVLLLVLVGGGAAAGFYAELEWFRSLGYEGRFWRLRLVQAGAWVAIFATAAATVWLPLRAVLRRGGPVQIRRRLGDLEIAEALPERWVQVAVAGAALLAGLLVAGPFAGPLGRQGLFAAGAESWGRADAVLGHDPRFYVFYLPLLRTLWSVATAVVTWLALALATLLLLAGRVRASEQGVTVDAFARRALAWLGAGVLLLISGHFFLSAYEAVAGGPVGYADVHGEIPARRLVSVLALVAAGAVVWGERKGSWRPALTALAALAVVWPVGLVLYPGALQRFKVEPNELELERPYISAEVGATRAAFRLDAVHRRPYQVETTPPDVETARRHTSSLPLWDDRPLKATFDQLQGLVAYHEFPDVDTDRYGERGSREQVAVAVREFAPSRLAASARTWQNLHLRYTHGQGWVVAAVDRATEGGEPAYYVRDLPPRVSEEAPRGLRRVEEPKVYFGELTTQYVVVPPDSFPEAGKPTGADLDNLARRALFAWALESKNILLRDPGEGTARLVWRRQVVQRVQHLVPFLLVDPDVYPVVHRGRVKWIVEGYAASRRFPLSRPFDVGGRRVNYLRSAVKAVVDGVTGDVTLYTAAPDDPLLSAYRRAFPGLFTPLETMPEELRRHLRYPRAVFQTQARVLEAYHMTEPEEFYQKQDLWSLGREVYEGQPLTVEPYFLLMPFPDVGVGPGDGPAGDGGQPAAGDAGQAGTAEAADDGPPPAQGAEADRQEFLLTVPFTPRNRDNLASFLMARNDPGHYGELWLFDLSGQQQVFGPRQVEVQIDQDPVISQQLSLWQQQGSRAIRGHLLLVPVEGYLLYVEPLFLVAEDREGAAPGLKRVIASAGDRVAMGATLDDALRRLLGEAARMAPLEADAGPGVGDADEDEAPSPAAAEEGEAERPPSLERVRELLRRADQALRQGDLARFGSIWEELRRAAGVSPGGTSEEGSPLPPGAADTARAAGGGR